MCVCLFFLSSFVPFGVVLSSQFRKVIYLSKPFFDIEGEVLTPCSDFLNHEYGDCIFLRLKFITLDVMLVL